MTNPDVHGNGEVVASRTDEKKRGGTGGTVEPGTGLAVVEKGFFGGLDSVQFVFVKRRHDGKNREFKEKKRDVFFSWQ